MAKKTKKYDMSRQNIVDALDDVYNRLAEIDTTGQSPDDVATEISEIMNDLGDLQSQVLDEV